MVVDSIKYFIKYSNIFNLIKLQKFRFLEYMINKLKKKKFTIQYYTILIRWEA